MYGTRRVYSAVVTGSGMAGINEAATCLVTEVCKSRTRDLKGSESRMTTIEVQADALGKARIFTSHWNICSSSPVLSGT